MQHLLIGAAVLLALALASAFAVLRGGESSATEAVWQQLHCADRDLTSDDDDEEHNKIWLCAINARVEDISAQTDRYPTLTNDVLTSCGSDANGELGKDQEMAECLLDRGL